MGFVGNILKTIFNPSIATASSQNTSLTGRDILSETSSESPEAPVMGSDNTRRKQQGIESLLVPNEALYNPNMKGVIS